MSRTSPRFPKKTARIRRFLPALTILSLLSGSVPFPALAQSPVDVIDFEANTRYERSLERFLFDLFNTLQRRDEDFTAAFELQKIEKAREDVNKLFQETQEELQNFGQSLEFSNDVGDARERDPRFSGLNDEGGGLYCNANANNPGCPPAISPLKDSRIIHDPYQYLYGDAYTKAQIYAYCYFAYLIWDQRGMLQERYSWLPASFAEEKATYDIQGGTDTERSVTRLIVARNSIVAAMHRGHAYLLNYPLHEIYGRTSPEQFDTVEPRCRQAMYILGGESPVTAEQDVNMWLELNRENDRTPTADDEDRFRRLIGFLPTLRRNIAQRTDWTWTELEASREQKNQWKGVIQYVAAQMQRIIEETQAERQATYIAGQGLRPENLYVTMQGAEPLADGEPAQFRINTEYVISPAVVLLQKMQAATQSLFDLAGQGFLYLDAEETPNQVLQAYNVVSTRAQNEERRICNNAGSCVLLDPWLKPAADFRSAAIIRTRTVTTPVGPITAESPRAIGVNPNLDADLGGPAAGSGLPAPWEDEGAYLNIANEKETSNSTRRYTVARYRLRQPTVAGRTGEETLSGFDEFDTDGRPRHQDNILAKQIGIDYPTNDWYDRVIEMYEPGIGVTGTAQDSAATRRNLRPERNRDFRIRDWQCYVALWLFAQDTERVPPPPTGEPAAFFVGQGVNTAISQQFTRTYCGMFGGGDADPAGTE